MNRSYSDRRPTLHAPDTKSGAFSFLAFELKSAFISGMSDCVAEIPASVPAKVDRPGHTFTPEERARGIANSLARRAQEREEAESEPKSDSLDPYQANRLVYVKGEIERLEGLASKAKLSADVDRFSRAMERWIGIYCKLAGIPDPGSYRPAKPRGRQAAERITPE